jgi:hypothetical protein
MIRFFGAGAVILALAFALVACETNPGEPTVGPASSSALPNSNAASVGMGFQPSKLGGGSGGGGY